MHTVAHLVHDYGLLVVAGVIGLESLGIPLPGETALIVASIIAGSRPELDIVAVILTAAAASSAGRAVGYWIGRRFGYLLLLRYGRYVWLGESRIKLGQYLFLRHGGKIIIVAQFLPVLRTIGGILAGANRMPQHQFMVTNVIGASLWAVFFGVIAYYFGREVERLTGPLVVVLALGTVIFLILAARFVREHEVQLSARAERALPGPLAMP
jgi:membrane protein DedA with SNARE-associated domain